MSNIKINELNTNSLNEVNEQEIKQVVGGNTQTSVQLASNEANVFSVFGGNVTLQAIDQESDQEIVDITALLVFP